MAPPKKSTKTPASDASVVDSVKLETENSVETPVDASVEVPVEVPVVEVPAPGAEPDKYDLVIDKLQSIVNETKDLIVVVKLLKKENAKAQKQVGKRQRKTGVDGAKRPASGITKPTRLSDDLCTFLGVASGTSMARTEVTKIINTYIKTNQLQDEADRRTIHPDAKLQKILLEIPEGKKLSFFNMQSFIKHQFIKA
jgi:chromatin remodeling complex protein RSC6